MAGIACARFLPLHRLVPEKFRSSYSAAVAFGSVMPDLDLFWTTLVVAATLDRTWVDVVRHPLRLSPRVGVHGTLPALALPWSRATWNLA